MGLITWIRNHATRKATDHAISSSCSFLFEPTNSGRAVTERSAMQMTAVYSCVRILAEAIGGLPLHVYRVRADGGKEKAPDHPLYRLLHDEPNLEMTSFVFRETLMTYLLLWGNAYAQVIRNGRGEVIGLYPLMPNRMAVGRDSAGRLYCEYQRTTDEPPNARYERVILPPSEVLHIPDLGFDRLVSDRPIAMAKNAIGMAQACEDYGASFFTNGAAPGGVLEHPGVIKDPARVRESWTVTLPPTQTPQHPRYITVALSSVPLRSAMPLTGLIDKQMKPVPPPSGDTGSWMKPPAPLSVKTSPKTAVYGQQRCHRFQSEARKHQQRCQRLYPRDKKHQQRHHEFHPSARKPDKVSEDSTHRDGSTRSEGVECS